ncbi:acyl-CoA dehydrogenase family protein [Arthrobacter sp. ISL-69]|uniref:acyl-CoA dehydrogenase family protein n=1 Tax=Arthrobacter sp. ISL-69 TaxID=2819113 RepID=UPI001BE99D55|nr:acyl-CoA dehydrogenase family protein [Arthrobacter sp. ISL-69]MBT2535458.1 acyl-CoA dehydrogenase family protein [Arthrobacter sp. ISL-69]
MSETTKPQAGESPESLEEFVARATAFLDANAEPSPARTAFQWGVGEDAGVKLWEEPDSAEERVRLTEARVWRHKRFDAGFGWLDGPTESGGRSLPRAYVRAYQRLEAKYQTPSETYFKLDHVLGPVLLSRGTTEVKESIPRALQRGELVACELFSEPDAGSDLFSVRTRATRTEGGWLLSGQKVWTSDAHLADIGVIFCRTSNEPGKRAFSAFVLDMHQQGVKVVPLRQMTGGAAFNEVYLDDAYVPDSYLLGEVGQGWDVTGEILARERAGIGAGLSRSGSGLANGSRLIALVRAMDQAEDPLVRQALVKTITGFWATKQLTRNGTDRAGATGYKSDPTPLVSKLALSFNLRRASQLAGQVLGPRLTADGGEWGTFSWNSLVLGEPGVHIFAGTDEIVRNSLAEKVLGLPRD